MTDRATVMLIVTILTLFVILAIFAMKFFVVARTARLKIAAEDVHRELTARAVKAFEDNSGVLATLQDSSADIKARLERIEKILKEVE
jgi:hypothetical protein